MIRVERRATRSGPVRPGREAWIAAGGAAVSNNPRSTCSSLVRTVVLPSPARKRRPDQASRIDRSAAMAGARKPASRTSSRANKVGRMGRCRSTVSRQQRAASTMIASGVRGSGKAAATQDKVVSSHTTPLFLVDRQTFKGAMLHGQDDQHQASRAGYLPKHTPSSENWVEMRLLAGIVQSAG